MEEEYFKNIVSLYNHMKLNEAVPGQQVKIADSGSDVNQATPGEYSETPVAQYSQQPSAQVQTSQLNQQVPEQSSEPVPVSGNEGLDDAAYMSNDSQGDPNLMMSPDAAISDKQKLVRLYNYLQNLLDYGKNFKNSLDNIDMDLLDDDQINSIEDYKYKLGNTLDKIRDYIVNVFSTEDSKKILYVLLSLRSELLTVIGGIRKILHLDREEEPEDK